MSKVAICFNNYGTLLGATLLAFTMQPLAYAGADDPSSAKAIVPISVQSSPAELVEDLVARAEKGRTRRNAGSWRPLF